MENISDNVSDSNCWYNWCFLHEFSEAYDKVHVTLSSIICIFGAISNVINIIVLTRQNMQTSVNVFLVGLSFAQFLLDTNYLGLLVFEQFRLLCFEFFWGYTANAYKLINVNLNVIFHTVAFTHTLALAIFRSLCLRWPIRANRFISFNDWAISCSIMIWLTVPVLCIPVYFTSTVSLITEPEEEVCKFDVMYDLRYADNPLLVSLVFWSFGVVVKLVPSIIFICLLGSIIRSLQSVENRREQCLRKRATGIHKRNGGPLKTTHTLIIILILCTLVELPHGLLNLLTAVNGEEFGVKIYDKVGSLLEFLTLLYSSINFCLYVVTNGDFRRTFHLLFLAKSDQQIPSIPRSRSISNLPQLTRTAESVGLIDSSRTSTWLK
ncbi:Thyrotropin-releasing hormone receptor [Aphelenchoides besseyi]|nr:Thyrotropin-releasing hormone receptor [Aphelenchoides besseyi]